jgi:hypothetical protein
VERYWTFRPFDAQDVKTVLDDWIGTYRKSPWAGTIPNNRFREVQSEAIGQLFSRGSTGLAAVDPSNPSHIIGWVVTETNSKGELRLEPTARSRSSTPTRPPTASISTGNTSRKSLAGKQHRRYQ